MSDKITVWNPLTRPVRVSQSGSLLGGMRSGQVDPSDPFAAEALKNGFIVAVNKRRQVVPAPVVAVVELPQAEATPQVEEAPQVEIAATEAEQVQEPEAEMLLAEASVLAEEAQDEKPAKTTRSKSASKEF